MKCIQIIVIISAKASFYSSSLPSFILPLLPFICYLPFLIFSNQGSICHRVWEREKTTGVFYAIQVSRAIVKTNLGFYKDLSAITVQNALLQAGSNSDRNMCLQSAPKSTRQTVTFYHCKNVQRSCIMKTVELLSKHNVVSAHVGRFLKKGERIQMC